MIWAAVLSQNRSQKGIWAYRSIAVVSICFGAFGLAPLVVEAITTGHSALAQLPILSDWQMPAFRSLILLVTCAPLCILIGFLLGSRLADSQLRIGLWSGLLIVPMLLGGGVNAFVFKLCVADIDSIATALQDRNLVAFWIAVFSMFLWQYVPCIAFFCWLNCSQIGSNLHEFAAAHRLSFFERLSDIYWPQCKNLLIYLFLLVSAACAAEYERSALVFRASQGTGTEFFSHWLLRAYFMIARVDPFLAGRSVLFYSAIFVALCVLVTAGVALLGGRVTPRLLRMLACWHLEPLKSHMWQKQLLLPLLIVMVLLPFIPTALRGIPFVTKIGRLRCLMPVLFPALMAIAVCTLFSVLSRFGWRERLSSFNRVSLALCLGIAAAGFMPPIALAFTGMWWLRLIQFAQSSMVSAVITIWWLMLCIRALPVFFPGYLATQFVVRSRELAFQSQYLASFWEVLNTSFLKRLGPIYAVFGVFVYAFMWSEYSLTSLFSGLSTSLCSPVLDLAVRIEGKGAEFNEAAGIILQMALPLLACSVGFGVWMKRRISLMRAL